MSFNASQIEAHMEVLGADGRHMGTVDGVEGDRLKLTKKGSPDGEHHFIKLIDIQGVTGGKVQLKHDAVVN